MEKRLTYEDLYSLTTEIKREIVGKPLNRFELIKPRTFQLLFGSVPLLLALQPNEVRFHLLKKVQPTTIDPFSNYFQKRLQDKICTSVSLLNDDRLLELRFSEEIRLIAALFPKKPNLYLVNPEGMIESSLYPVKEPLFNPPNKPPRNTINPPSQLLSAQLEFQIAQDELVKQLQHGLKKGESLLKTLATQLQKCNEWETVHHEGLLLQSNFHALKQGIESIEVNDWKSESPVILHLDPHSSPHENIAERFKLAKRLQTGRKGIEENLEKQTAKLQLLKEKLAAVEQAQTLNDLPQPQIKKLKAPLPKKGLPYTEFLSKNGLSIWVGKGAAKNDLLTFKYAKGSDWWLHVQGYPGSHVVIRTQKNLPPDEETLQDALTLAIEHSKAKGERSVEVLVTQRKYVTKLGKTGQVQVSRHKLLHSHLDKERLSRLKKNK